MKVLCSALLVCCFISVNAQHSYELRELFTESKITWFGIDYSKTNFVGTYNKTDMNVYFHGWNRLAIEEPLKYDLAKFFQKKFVKNEIQSVEEINAATDANITAVNTDSSLTKLVISKMVRAYKSEEVDGGIGLVLLAERYNNSKNYASHVIVFFDIASRNILISQRIETPPAGIGIRNHWAGSIYTAFKIAAHNYKKWSKKYRSKKV